MDKNKLRVLEEAGYKIQSTCSTCKHSSFPNNEWGTCELHLYNHLKHSDTTRQLSIHKTGYCKEYRVSETKLETLGTFRSFHDTAKT